LTLDILSLTPLPEAIQNEIRAAGPSINLTMAPNWFDGEIRESWPAFTTQRYVAEGSNGKGTRDERDALLAASDIAIVGFPFPLDMRSRAPKLKWVHQRPAGTSNMLRGDLWKSEVVVTSSRGYAHNLPIAEYTLAGILHFAKGLHVAEIERGDRRMRARDYQPVQLAGKTLCVVGAGGIGREVGRLCAAVGMRVVGTRRNASTPAEGFAEIRGTDGLHDLLAESDYVAVCCQWTPETEKLIGDDAFSAMKDGAVVLNIARGEIIDEEALIRALADNKLRGAVLDVYVGEFDRPPDARLWDDNRVLITPHISAAADINSHKGNALFVENLKRYVAGEVLENVIDWDRGY
jgi:phosphoglycerate dehydrogenase-like enzyme